MKQHNYPHLPQYFAVKRDENNLLWNEYIQWLWEVSTSDVIWSKWLYTGFDDSNLIPKHNGFSGVNSVEQFHNPVKIITLEQWKQAIDKPQDMKETEFKPGEFCRFPNSEIPAMLDLLRENGHNVYESEAVYQPEQNIILCSTDGDLIGYWTKALSGEKKELTREQFMFKATRGKGTIKESLIVQSEFDSQLPFEVSHDGEHWTSKLNGQDLEFYHGITGNHGYHIVENFSGVLNSYKFIRNILPHFTASMLEVGEYMETEPGNDGKCNLLTKVGHNIFIDINNIWSGEICLLHCDQEQIKGRRVKVKITTEEV